MVTFVGLQAHDFEAYQELLREQGGTDTSSERYEVISRFLNDTEEYLHRLAGKVASVKLAQEASEAAALAIAESRAQVGSSDVPLLGISLCVLLQPVSHTIGLTAVA